MNGIARLYWIARAMGWRNIPWRVLRALQVRLWRRTSLPAADVPADAYVTGCSPDDADTFWRRRAEKFFMTAGPIAPVAEAVRKIVPDPLWQQHVAAPAGELARGRMLFFDRVAVDIGRPMNFNRDPVHGVDWPVGRHYSKYVQFDPQFDDIKCVMEASRFGWAYGLVRQALVSGENQPLDLFWELLAEWDRQNPYLKTVGWSCGQEASFRIMAWLTAGCASAGRASRANYRRLSELIWLSTQHIARNVAYARSQHNNHAISEAAVLWTVGLLFPEFRESGRWLRKGRGILAAEVRQQVYDDGSYVQHSMNYHRLMLDDLLWAVRLGELSGQRLDEVVYDRLAKATDWLIEMIDPPSGRVPNYGPNDGANILPLSVCDYLDYRPTAQAASFLVKKERAFEPGPWDEKMLWLCGSTGVWPVSNANAAASPRAPEFAADAGGYYVFRGRDSRAMIRCHSYRDRPNQADMLHVDLFNRGVNVLRDGGSYLYYCPPPWQEWFGSTAAHNTVVVNGRDQMIRGPRFLWFRWTRSRVIARQSLADGSAGGICCEHYGYKPVIHRRALCRLGETYLIVDDLLDPGRHELALRWRLCPEETWRRQGELWLAMIAGQSLALAVRGPVGMTAELLSGVDSPRPEGWESLYYGQKQPAPTVVARFAGDLPVRFVTLIGPAPLVAGVLPAELSPAGTALELDSQMPPAQRELVAALTGAHA